jgi:hypothetical protein
METDDLPEKPDVFDKFTTAEMVLPLWATILQPSFQKPRFPSFLNQNPLTSRITDMQFHNRKRAIDRSCLLP